MSSSSEEEEQLNYETDGSEMEFEPADSPKPPTPLSSPVASPVQFTKEPPSEQPSAFRPVVKKVEPKKTVKKTVVPKKNVRAVDSVRKNVVDSVRTAVRKTPVDSVQTMDSVPKPPVDSKSVPPRSVIQVPADYLKRKYSRLPMASASEARKRLKTPVPKKRLLKTPLPKKPKVKSVLYSPVSPEPLLSPLPDAPVYTLKSPEPPVRAHSPPVREPSPPVPSRVSTRPTRHHFMRRPNELKFCHHNGVMAVLCMNRHGFTLTNGVNAFHTDHADGRHLCKAVTDMNVVHLVATDQQTRVAWKRFLDTLCDFHIFRKIPMVVLDPKPNEKIGECMYCHRLYCHRWWAVTAGISKMLHHPVEPIEH